MRVDEATRQSIDPPDTARRSGAEAIVQTLEDLGVSHIFGIPGGNVIPFYDALHTAASLRGVLVRHEEGAVHAAHGYAVASAAIGVCVATSGPGATNLVTGLADACADSAPVLAITGAVFSTLQGTDAFQEADIFGMTEGITKHSFRVTHPDDIAPTLLAAHHIATTGRPGPVLVDITKDAQQGITAARDRASSDHDRFMIEPSPSAAELAAVARLLLHAERPVFAAGTGILRSNAAAALRELADRTGTAVLVSGAAHGVSGADDPHSAGVIGGRFGQEVIASCDALITVGLRSSAVRSLAARVRADSPVVQIDVDPFELASDPGILPIEGDARETLVALAALIPSASRPSSIAWLQELRNAHRHREPAQAAPDAAGALRRISALSPAGSIFVGEYAAPTWVSDALGVAAGSVFFTSGGFVRQGFAIPAALGAKFARPDRTVWAVTDAAGFQASGRELATAAVERVPIKVVVLSPSGRSVPDAALLGDAMGAVGIPVERASDIPGAVQTALRHSDRSVVIDLRLGAPASYED